MTSSLDTTALESEDADVWRTRYEMTSVQCAEAEQSRDRWQQCALDFAELLKAAGIDVGEVEPLLLDIATSNVAAAIDAEIGRSYRESVATMTNHARNEMLRTSNSKQTLEGLMNRLEKLTSATEIHTHRSRQTAKTKVSRRRGLIREALGLPPRA